MACYTLTAVIVTLLLYPAYNAYCLWRNYLKARTIGLPIIIFPFSPTNVIWFLLSQNVHALLLRVGLGNLTRFSYLGWQFQEKAAPHLETGNVIVQVTPDKLWVDMGDPDAITQIFHGERKGLFSRPYEGIKMLDVFGPNISTASPEDWVRMRRLTASSFNDNTNKMVWSESVRQGTQMLAKWLAAGTAGITSTADDTRQFALNVMLGAGFGKVYDFDTKPDTPSTEAQGKMDYRQALKLVLENAILIIGLGPKNVPKLGFLSNKLATVGTAVATYQQYMTDMLHEGTKTRGNLLSTLVRASVEENQLSEREVYGNMFVYTFGGHDTTAHSLAFTFVLLSIHPEVQTWVREEMREVLDGDDASRWTIDDFAKLKRTHAVQLEVLRLYNPLLGIVKATSPEKPVQLTLENGTRPITLPGDVRMTININAVHSHPSYWGVDALEWRPSRFICVDEAGEEQITPQPKGVFQPWSDGIRSCPGKKFGQVEHAALMATMLYGHEVTPSREKGESEEDVRKRIMGVVRDSGMVLNIQMRHPENAKLVWAKC